MRFIVTTKTGEKLPQWYFGKVYENYDAATALWTWIGIHAIFKIGRYIYQLWNMYRGRKTWFDRQYIKAFNDGVVAGYKQAIQQNNMAKDFVAKVKRQLGTLN